MRILLLALLAASAASAAGAQSMTPMRGEVQSYSDEFALKVFPHNVYTHRIGFEMHAYDQDFRPVEAMIWPQSFSLAAGQTRPVTVVVPFDGTSERRIRVCAESVPFPDQKSLVKAQICGRFLARRLQ